MSSTPQISLTAGNTLPYSSNYRQIFTGNYFGTYNKGFYLFMPISLNASHNTHVLERCSIKIS